MDRFGAATRIETRALAWRVRSRCVCCLDFVMRAWRRGEESVGMWRPALWGGLLCCALACGSKAKHDAADAGGKPPTHTRDAGSDAAAHDAGAADAGPRFDAGS